MRLTSFNTLPADECVSSLREVCAAERWARAVAHGRPYSTAEALVVRSAKELAKLTWAEIEGIIAGHSRLGSTPAGGGEHVEWSRREQSALTRLAVSDAARLSEANRRYERRFGRVFFVCAASLELRQVLTTIEERLGNTDEAERVVVRSELGKLVDRRLEGLVQP